MPPLDKLTGPLGTANAAHLLRRATFAPTPQNISDFAAMDIDTAMGNLFQTVALPAPPVDPSTGTTWLTPVASGGEDQEDLIDYFTAWHMEQMRISGASIKERLVWFLHTHLPIKRTTVPSSEGIYYQNALYRYYAFGDFKELFLKVCVDNAMLLFIDNATNDVDSPNENYAREMFELYSIGRGKQISEGNYTNYTEDDVKAATRVLTGYINDETFSNTDPDTGIPTGQLITVLDGSTEVASRHDADPKQFSAAFGSQLIEPSVLHNGFATKEAAEGELSDMIDMIFDQDETARFLARKLYRYFVYYEITDEIETGVIVPLAAIFRTGNYSLETVVRALLSSVHFFDQDNGDTGDDNKGAIIKSPVEVVLNTCNLFDVVFPTADSTLYETVYQEGLLLHIDNQGLMLYEPYDVAGYAAYFQFPNFNRNWISPYSLAYRYQFADLLINGVNDAGDPLGIQLDILDWVKTSGHIAAPSDANALVQSLVDWMFPYPLNTERFNFFLNDIFLDGFMPSTWSSLWTDYLSNPGAYAATVKSQLETIVRALMQSPEYQLL